MVYRGTVKNGIVVFDDDATPGDGVRVTIQPLEDTEAAEQPSPKSLANNLLKLAGIAGPGLPTDLARNHDHYLHGLPKR